MRKYEMLILFLIVFLGAFLRFYQIQNNPPGLYIDEAAIGYNAYTILHKGVDQYGARYPLFFKSFGDYKPPVYIYSVALTMSILGKNELSVRLPSALSGTLTVLVLYFLLKVLLDLNKKVFPTVVKVYLPIISTFLLSISTWHIHFSRGGFEVNQALFFYILGLYLILLFWKYKSLGYLLGGFLCYLITIYTYHTYRIMAPITVIIFAIIFLKELPKKRKSILVSGIVFLLLSTPLFLFSLTPQGSARYAQTSAFSEYPAVSTNQKLFIYPMVYVKNYLSFFSLDFLFGSGDGNGRHQISGFGLIPRWQVPFLLLGIWVLLKQKKSMLKYFVLGLLFLSPLPAAIARPSPHSLRSLVMVLPLTVLIALGLIGSIQQIRKFKKIFVIVISLIAVYQFIIYLHFYYVHYPNVNSLDWGAGNKETALKAAGYKKKYKYLVIDENLIRTSIYFNFYDSSLSPIIINSSFIRPKNWGDKPVLFIRPNYGGGNNGLALLDQVYLNGPNKDIYSQFFKL